LIKIDRSSKTPLYRQIYQQIQEAILTGKMPPRHILLGSRVLSKELGVGRNTVNSAFAQLTAEGYIEAQQGVGFIVLEVANHKFSCSKQASTDNVCISKNLNRQVNVYTEEIRITGLG